MTKAQTNNKFKTLALALLDGLYALSTFIVALTFTWIVLALSNFFYGFWHDHTGIEQTIAEFGPQNIHRDGFEHTTRQQRIELFGEINKAIHRHGKGLEEITYQVSGQTSKLLHQAEITHLNDVALLVYRLLFFSTLVFLMWIVVGFQKIKSKRSLPSLKAQALGILIIFAMIGLAILLVGATELFYWLHTLVFPANHQWFFYYQDSLMSTMMQAPTLFGWIGATWAALSIVVFVAIHAGLTLLKRTLSNF